MDDPQLRLNVVCHFFAANTFCNATARTCTRSDVPNRRVGQLARADGDAGVTVSIQAVDVVATQTSDLQSA